MLPGDGRGMRIICVMKKYYMRDEEGDVGHAYTCTWRLSVNTKRRHHKDASCVCGVHGRKADEWWVEVLVMVIEMEVLVVAVYYPASMWTCTFNTPSAMKFREICKVEITSSLIDR